MTSSHDIEHLSEKTCGACITGAPQVTTTALAEALEKLPDWSVIEINGVKQLMRAYRFKNFLDALEFTNQVGAIAEEFNHHPALLTEWGKVIVHWWTHKIKGLHDNDIIMAAKTEKLFNQIQKR